MSGRGNGSDRPNVASLAEARKRAEAKAKAERRASPGTGQRSVRDLVVGGTIIIMAVGFLVSLVLPLVKG